ncbi:uncharacterized protein LOC114319377 [Camellia sinensis]|uniref:uncharacterized protein LOC114319377 n=1 Tax=Camellia sinensis TaxID=4442 RepID=UPI001035E3EA|nr:uncharacterized protein LOC114319377 [Camellia sinensis]
MKGLRVWWCGSLEIIFDLLEGVCASASSSGGAGEEETSITPLDFLELKYFPKLMHIWKNVSQEIHCFESLTSLIVEWCDYLRYIFTISMANVLVNLEDLYIRHCEKVETIVTRENEEEILFRQFPHVELTNLPSLVCFGPDINDIEILCIANDSEDHYYDYNKDDFDDEDYEEDFGPSDTDFPFDYYCNDGGGDDDDDGDDGDDFGNDDDGNDNDND